ncbi:MAG: PD-(D/E)XK nuclease family protein [Actinomycetota bacterium]|nr:PD-(D/E)XK nuclease family protein [Actinomycetota bacterium]
MAQPGSEVTGDMGAAEEIGTGRRPGRTAPTDIGSSIPLPLEAPGDLPDAPGAYGELEPAGSPLLDGEGRVRLSFSRIETYETCPAKFRFAYLEGLPGVPGPHLSFGSSIHAALERFYDQKLPVCPSEQDLLGFLYEEWDSSGFEGLSRDEQLLWYRHAQGVLRRFHARESLRYRLPADVEKWFSVPFGADAVVMGYIDRVDVDDDGRLEVIDYKTNKRVKDRDRVRSSLQLSIYALACEHLYGRMPSAVTLYFVVPGVQVQVATDEIDFDGARRTVSRVAAAVRAEYYDPAPSQACNWCEFRRVCPAWDGEGSDALGPAIEELERLRRRVRRDVRALRELEAGVARLSHELADRLVSPPPG